MAGIAKMVGGREMVDYLMLINGQPNATQRALLKVSLQATQVSDVTIDNAFYHFVITHPHFEA